MAMLMKGGRNVSKIRGGTREVIQVAKQMEGNNLAVIEEFLDRGKKYHIAPPHLQHERIEYDLAIPFSLCH